MFSLSSDKPLSKIYKISPSYFFSSEYEKLSNNFATEYVNSNEFAKLKQNERIRLITRFFEENIVISAMELWKAHQHIFGKAMPMSHAFEPEGKTPRDITRNLHCAENLLCDINSHSRKQASLIR